MMHTIAIKVLKALQLGRMKDQKTIFSISGQIIQ
jgi:hypothetical protein